MKKVVIVLPVYQVEKYISKCIESIKNQNYKDFLAIFVNDGTKDSSIEIAKKLVIGDDRFVFLDKENGGVSSARNYALDYLFLKSNLEFDYIMFLDSDDYIEENMILDMVNCIQKDDSDMVIVPTENIYVDKQGKKLYSDFKKILPENEESKIFTKEEVLEMQYFSKKNEGIIFSIINGKMFKKEIIRDIRFPINRIHEDEYTTYKTYLKAKKISYIDKGYYKYIQRANSIMSSKFNIQRFDMIEALLERIEILKKEGIDTYSTKYSLLNKIYYLITNAKKTLKNKENILNNEEIGQYSTKILESKKIFKKIYNEMFWSMKLKHKLKIILYFFTI